MVNDGLLKILDDIIKGYNEAKYNKKTVYIKHFSLLDQANFERLYDHHYKRAKARNVHTEKEKLEFCIQKKLWSEEKEREIVLLEKTIVSLDQHKKRAILPSQLETTITRIKNEKKKLENILFEKKNILGFTCETFANEKLNNYYIDSSFYKDFNLNEKLFSQEEFEDLNKGEILNLVSIYNEAYESYATAQIKKIAISIFFQNYYGLCGDDPYRLLGKPIISLTQHQVNLLSYGRYYKHLLSHVENVPNDIMQDPDKLIDYVEMNRNRESKIGANKNKNVGVFGATKKDLAELNKDFEIDNTHQMATKDGKKGLNMRELLDLQNKKV